MLTLNTSCESSWVRSKVSVRRNDTSANGSGTVKKRVAAEHLRMIVFVPNDELYGPLMSQLKWKIK